MPTTPEIVALAAQPYAGITKRVTMNQIGEQLPPLHGEVFGWLAARGISPAGAPFFKYNVIDMEGELEIEVGVPVAEAVPGDERVRAGLLPAGRYATVTHVGPYEELMDATARLLSWGGEQGVKWDASDDQRRWGARLECYETDPREQPDPATWVTELRFRLAD
jgi:effector-binding domain-containing protein